MKYALILPIVVLAMLAFATSDATAEPCAAQEGAVATARVALDSANESLSLAQQSQSAHLKIGHVLRALAGESPGSEACTICMSNYYTINQARTAVRTKKADYDRAVRVRDNCLATHICPACNQIGSHLLDDQPACTHMVYSCQGSSVGTHNQVTGECGHTYWQCGSGGSSHKQVTCTDYTVTSRQFNYGVYRTVTSTAGGCGVTYWYCKDSGNHRITGYMNTIWRVCVAARNEAARRNSGNSNGGNGNGGNSNGGNSGTTTSPTVQNNGGNTGGTGGTSSDRVRCGHGNACSRGGYASSRYAHKVTCPAGHRYYECSATGTSRHANCRAQGSGEVRCARNSWCRSGGWASSRNAHQTTCSAGHTYWSCSPTEVRRHRNCRS